MEHVEKFLKEAQTYYLATMEGDQPRVRPFGTIHIFEGKLYIQTGKKKDVSKQLHQNPKAEICAFKNGEWLRVSGELVEDDRTEARQSMLDAYPSLREIFMVRKREIRTLSISQVEGVCHNDIYVLLFHYQFHQSL